MQPIVPFKAARTEKVTIIARQVAPKTAFKFATLHGGKTILVKFRSTATTDAALFASEFMKLVPTGMSAQLGSSPGWVVVDLMSIACDE